MAPVMSLSDSRARAERAFQLRAIGWSWRQVAGQLGYRSVGAAQVAVKRHERRSGVESVESSRRSLIESARITTRVLFDRFSAAVDRGDDYTAALLNRELRGNRDQLSRLQGAYMPERAEVDVNVHQSPREIIAEAERQLLAVVDERSRQLALSNVVDAEVVSSEQG